MIEIPARELTKNMELEVRITGVKLMFFRFVTGMLLVKFGVWIMGFRRANFITGGEVAEEQARHDVKAGVES